MVLQHINYFKQEFQLVITMADIIEDEFWNFIHRHQASYCKGRMFRMPPECRLQKPEIFFNADGVPEEYEKCAELYWPDIPRYVIYETFPESECGQLAGLTRLASTAHSLDMAREKVDNKSKLERHNKGYMLEIYERNPDNASLATLLPKETVSL
jgi:hypothetical protein